MRRSRPVQAAASVAGPAGGAIFLRTLFDDLAPLTKDDMNVRTLPSGKVTEISSPFRLATRPSP
jgi:hypothetical protein